MLFSKVGIEWSSSQMMPEPSDIKMIYTLLHSRQASGDGRSPAMKGKAGETSKMVSEAWWQ